MTGALSHIISILGPPDPRAPNPPQIRTPTPLTSDKRKGSIVRSTPPVPGGTRTVLRSRFPGGRVSDSLSKCTDGSYGISGPGPCRPPWIPTTSLGSDQGRWNLKCTPLWGFGWKTHKVAKLDLFHHCPCIVTLFAQFWLSNFPARRPRDRVDEKFRWGSKGSNRTSSSRLAGWCCLSCCATWKWKTPKAQTQ